MNRIYFIVATVIMLDACSTGVAKRTTYETLENIRLQRCAADYAADCNERESYNEYTRKRDEAIR